MLRVTFEDGTVQDYREDEVIEIENYPPSDTPKPGWERTRDYPPEYRRATPLRASVLTDRHRVHLHNGFIKVVKVEKLIAP
ncbi:hypothetical protein BDK63_003639 [Halomonas campaniensis]|uniref:Uncharacterized protein n=1 Tax=Halomonas campaniensis TaxID=213554 RepID=A0A7W5PD81_9GAMM|nr:hypothetical protein [Halomonas campaniensis]MBB3332736.1 hypothetical protein [Halomonas campaniensis]